MIPKFAKVIDHNHLIRDMHNQAILNTDTSIIRKHENRQIELQKDKNREAEINSLRIELFDIKKMLQELLTKDATG